MLKAFHVDFEAGLVEGVQSSCYLSSESHSWFKTKQALVENNHVCFLEEAASYIEQGPKDTPRLWYAMLADLVILCRGLDIPEARLMRQTIAKDSENWKGVPHAWKSLYRFDKEVS